jgi:hypothetical protein
MGVELHEQVVPDGLFEFVSDLGEAVLIPGQPGHALESGEGVLDWGCVF